MPRGLATLERWAWRSDGGNRGDPVSELAAEFVAHEPAVGVAGGVDALLVDLVAAFEVVEHFADKADVVGVVVGSGWAAAKGIPGSNGRCAFFVLEVFSGAFGIDDDQAQSPAISPGFFLAASISIPHRYSSKQ